MARKVFHLLMVLGAVLCVMGTGLFIRHLCYAQTPYYGPTSPTTGLIPIQIQFYDDPSLGGVTIEEASFDGQEIPLKPSGIRGYRGGGSFKKAPGSYELLWTISRPGTDWPRTVQHQQIIDIKEGDVWVQLAIHGETATIL